MPIKISVIIPTHNRSILIKRAIESVINQTFPPFEILVIDDYGCEETKALIKTYTLDNIHYIFNSKGKGASSSRNVGVSLAKGNFIAFLDDDDEWKPIKLEKQYNLLKTRNLDACFSQVCIKYENSPITYSTKSMMPNDFKKMILFENFIGGTISAIIRKEIFLLAGGFDEKLPAREEYNLWINISKITQRIEIIESPLAIGYRSLTGRSRISRNINNYIEAMDIINTTQDEYIKSILTKKEMLERRRMQYNFLAAQGITIGLRNPSCKYYIKSIIIRPSIKSIAGLILGFISPSLLLKIRQKI